jgi:hypothetical protein
MGRNKAANLQVGHAFSAMAPSNQISQACVLKIPTTNVLLQLSTLLAILLAASWTIASQHQGLCGLECSISLALLGLPEDNPSYSKGSQKQRSGRSLCNSAAVGAMPL